MTLIFNLKNLYTPIRTPRKNLLDIHSLAARAVAYFKDFFYRSLPHGNTPAERYHQWGRIAVIVSHEKNTWAVSMTQRFVSALRDQMGYQHTPDIEIHSSQGSSAKVKQIMAAIKDKQESRHNYELVVTVGNWCSKEVRDALDGWEHPLPQIFAGASDPVGMGIVDSLEYTGRNVSGVTAVLPVFEDQFDMLQAILPEMKTVLLAYDAHANDKVLSTMISSYITAFKVACKKRSIAIKELLVDSHGRTPGEVVDYLSGVDLVCTLPEVTMFANIDTLVAACNKARVPLCTAELSSVYHGAAIGFGEYGGAYGPYVASIVYDMLVNRRSLRTIPVINLPSIPQMRFNQEALDAQGVQLSRQMRHLMAMRSIFHDSL